MWRPSSARQKSLPSTMRLPGPRLMGLRGAAMELFIKLFGDLLVFVYHCFDRIVIHGSLRGLSPPEQVVYFFRQIVGAPVVSKELLSQRTADYQNWVEAFARNHDIPIEWAEKGVRKEDYVQPWLRKMIRKDAYGVYFIFKSMEQGPSFRITVPKFPTKDPNHRILARQKSRFPHDYFTFISAMKSWAPLSCGWRRSFRSRLPITSTGTASLSRSSIGRRLVIERMT